MRFDNIPREVWFGIFVLFMLSMRFPPLVGLLLILGMIYFSQNMMNNVRNDVDRRSQNQRQGRYYDYDAREVPRRQVETQPTMVAPRAPQIDHVAQAISNAGQHPDELAVLPLDIGVLTYKDAEPPQLYRMDEIPDDVDYIQPFVELELPSAVTGRVRFEIIDGSGQPVFIEENAHRFHAGAQPIVAQTRLPIHDAHDFDEEWHLKVYAENVLLADHHFAWNNAVNVSPILQHIQEDGEISAELREVLAQTRLERMSIDELLDFQDDASSDADDDRGDYRSESQRQARRRS